jgi:hypothetical protein
MVMVKYKKCRSMCRNKRTKGSVHGFGVGKVWDKTPVGIQIERTGFRIKSGMTR